MEPLIVKLSPHWSSDHRAAVFASDWVKVFGSHLNNDCLAMPNTNTHTIAVIVTEDWMK